MSTSPRHQNTMSDLYQSLSHTKWDCKYHVVFVPKRRRKVLFGNIRRSLGQIFHTLAKQKECEIIEGHVMPDHSIYWSQYPPSLRSAQWSVFWKARAPSQSPDNSQANKETSQASTSRQEAMQYLRSGSTPNIFRNISEIRKGKISSKKDCFNN